MGESCQPDWQSVGTLSFENSSILLTFPLVLNFHRRLPHFHALGRSSNTEDGGAAVETVQPTFSA